MTYNQENMSEFKRITREIHRKTHIRPMEIAQADLVKCEEMFRYGCEGRRENRRYEITWRLFRQKVAQFFRRDHGIQGTFDWQIDWTAAYEWLVKNWVAILKMLVVLIGVVV